MTADHLGSPRIITDATGQIIARKDFAAFGDETFTAQRTTAIGYKPENIRQDYTGYQKDEESGLEFAQARYYNPSHGRFTSVDPLTASASIRDPQTFNRYSYVLNSPYKFTDPLGLLPQGRDVKGNSCEMSRSNIGSCTDGSNGRLKDVTGQQANAPETPPKEVSNVLAAKTETISGATINEDSPRTDTADVTLTLNSTALGILATDGAFFFEQRKKEQAQFDEAMSEIGRMEKAIATELANPEFKIDRSKMEVGSPINLNSQEFGTELGINIGEVISASATLSRTLVITNERVSTYNATVSETNVAFKTRIASFADNPRVANMRLRINSDVSPRTVRYRTGENSAIKSVLQYTYGRRMSFALSAGHERVKEIPNTIR